MVNRKFNVAVIGNPKGNAGIVTASLNLSKNSAHFNLNARTHPVRKDNDEDILVDNILSREDDLYVVDFNHEGTIEEERERNLIRSVVLAKKIRAKRPYVPIISVNEFSSGRKDYVRPYFRELVKNGVLNDFLDLDPRELTFFRAAIESGNIKELVKRTNAPKLVLDSVIDFVAKPLTVGVVGHGAFARYFTSLCDTNPAVIKHATVYSRTLAKMPDAKEGIAEGYTRGNVDFVRNLEELVALQPDFLVITSSGAGILADGTKKFPVNGDFARISLFPYEAELHHQIWDVLVKADYKGAVVVATNPPGGVAEIGVRKGFDPQRITFPFNADTTRVMRPFRAYLTEVISRDSPNKRIEDFSDLINHIERYCIVGLHGMPMFAPSSIVQRFLEMPSLSWGIGEKQARLQIKMDIPMKEAAEEMFNWFRDVAKYKVQPRATCYVYDKSHFVSLPCEIKYPDNGEMRFLVNEIDGINMRRIGIEDYPDFSYSLSDLEHPSFNTGSKDIDLRRLLVKHAEYYESVQMAQGLIK